MKNLFIASQFEADFFLDDYNQVDNNVYEKDCRIIVTGIGLVNTAISCTQFFSDYGISEEDEYINIGIAGAVNKAYTVGEIIEAKSFSVFNAADIPESSQSILELAYPKIGNGTISLASSPAPVWGKPSIDKLKELKVDLVDMEAYSFAKVCTEKGITFKVIKSVSDHLTKSSQNNFLKNAKQSTLNLKKHLEV